MPVSVCRNDSTNRFHEVTERISHATSGTHSKIALALPKRLRESFEDPNGEGQCRCLSALALFGEAARDAALPCPPKACPGRIFVFLTRDGTTLLSVVPTLPKRNSRLYNGFRCRVVRDRFQSGQGLPFVSSLQPFPWPLFSHVGRQ